MASRTRPDCLTLMTSRTRLDCLTFMTCRNRPNFFHTCDLSEHTIPLSGGKDACRQAKELLPIRVIRANEVFVFVGCLTSQQHASVSQGRICSDNFTCCHTEIKVADQTFYLTQSQYTDTGPTSPSTDPITPGAWQGSHWSANFEVTGMTRPRKKSRRKRDSNPGPCK